MSPLSNCQQHISQLSKQIQNKSSIPIPIITHFILSVFKIPKNHYKNDYSSHLSLPVYRMHSYVGKIFAKTSKISVEVMKN